MAKTLWRSPNKKWEIVDDSEDLRFKTDWNDPYSTVARVSASDGWMMAYASILVNGQIHINDFNTNWDYSVPSTVQQKGYVLLRSLYKEKKQKAMGSSQLPIQYVVLVQVVGTTRGTPVPKPTFYRTFETAVKHAQMEWKKLSPYQRSNGAFVNVGRLNKLYTYEKDVPDRFGYSLLGSITKDEDPFKKKWRF